MLEYVKYFLILFILAIVQKTLIWLIEVTNYQITPDIVLIGLVLIGIRHGKIVGCMGGFIVGLILDLFSFSFIGLMALSKSAAGFVSGYFNNENKIQTYVSTYIFIIIVFFCSLINNLIYFWVYFQGTALSFTDLILRYVIPTALYTSVFSILIVIFSRKKLVLR